MSTDLSSCGLTNMSRSEKNLKTPAAKYDQPKAPARAFNRDGLYFFGCHLTTFCRGVTDSVLAAVLISWTLAVMDVSLFMSSHASNSKVFLSLFSKDQTLGTVLAARQRAGSV